MKKILVIEDSPEVLSNTAEILKLAGYQVLVAENGKIGVAKAIKYQPDLIICDIMMPFLDGYGVLHAIQKNESIRKTAFIFLTAKADRSDFRKGMEQGCDDYITKPFKGEELLKAVEGSLKRIESRNKGKSETMVSGSPQSDSSDVTQIIRDFIKDRIVNCYEKKQVIYSEGDHPNNFYYIAKGKAKAFKLSNNGKELVTDLFNEGVFFGYIPLIEDKPYLDTAVALEYTELALIPKEDFSELLRKAPLLIKYFMQWMASDISERKVITLGLAYNSLRKKVAESLLMLQRKFRADTTNKFLIDMNRDSLASIAGTAKESLIRTLGDFRDEKLIEIKSDGKISITNSKKLEQLID